MCAYNTCVEVRREEWLLPLYRSCSSNSGLAAGIFTYWTILLSSPFNSPQHISFFLNQMICWAYVWNFVEFIAQTNYPELTTYYCCTHLHMLERVLSLFWERVSLHRLGCPVTCLYANWPQICPLSWLSYLSAEITGICYEAWQTIILFLIHSIMYLRMLLALL